MHEWILMGTVIWLSLLLVALSVYAVRPRSALDRLLALDTLTLVVIALFAAVAAYRRSAGYLDAAVVLALLSFVQTVAVARYLARRRFLG